MNGSGKRSKGHNGERELVAEITKAIHVKRPLSRNIDQVRGGGADITSLPPFAIEVKRQEQLNLNAWKKQAIAQATRDNPIPVLAYRQNRRPWRVCIPAQYLVKKKVLPRGSNVEWLEFDFSYFVEVICGIAGLKKKNIKAKK